MHYVFYNGGISDKYNTPYIDMAYEDSHIDSNDGLAYYPNNYELTEQFPMWNFGNNTDQSKQNDSLIWIPIDGDIKYHSYDGCSNMYNPIQVTKEEAIERGYSQCQKCW